ncbi:unnamed protein product [Sympodiomycopsis kandeliae]
MAANEPDPSRLLSIQSHVVSGYVGNRSATFPLQLLGWDVDVINTVQFSNHTGYGRWKGLRFDEEHVSSLLKGLEQNGLLKQSRMLSGYMPSPNVVSTIRDAVSKIKTSYNPNLIYLCDPVMGDMGRGMYVDPKVLPVYQSMLPYTTIITPNQFEAQSLAGQEITDIPSLLKVLESLHQRGASNVIITSVELPESELAKIGATPTMQDDKSMILVGSTRSSSSSSLHPWYIQFPEIKGYFSGVGDLFAALLIGRFQPESKSTSSVTPIASAAEEAIASVQSVLYRTLETTKSLEQDTITSHSEQDPVQQRVETMRRRELRLIQSRKEIEFPNVQHKARWIPLDTSL